MTPLTDLTTAELQRLARHMLRRYLDATTTGDPASLTRLLARDALLAAERLTAAAQRDRSVRHADLGPVAVLRLGPDRVYAAAQVLRDGAVDAVVCAHIGVEQGRIVALRIGEATHSINHHAEAAAVGPGQPPPRPPAYLTGILGDLPTDPHTAQSWLSAAAVIDTYRQRHHITDTTSALGPTAHDPEQAEERQRAVDHIRAITADLRVQRDTAREATRDDYRRGPELGR